MLRDELDMLECRLAELEDSPVYRHVLVEAPVTHRGVPKPLYYQENQARFARWADKIIHVVAHPPGASDPWDREHAQRDAAWEVLKDAAPYDRLLLSDIDEIPSPAVWEATPPVLLMMRVAVFAVDWLWPVLEPCGVLVRASDAGPGLGSVRDGRKNFPQLNGAGWHLSWMGGHSAHLAKLASHCHLEQDTREIVDRITTGRAFSEGWHIDTKLIAADVDETWPRYVYERRCPASWFRPR